ncbi:MAG: hypothetical protein EZS28_056321, partial [Streblomastix strix]
HIIQMQEKTIMDTKEKIVGIFSIMIQVFRLPHAGAGGGRTIPQLSKLMNSCGNFNLVGVADAVVSVVADAVFELEPHRTLKN